MRVMSRPCVSRPWCSTCRLVGKAEGASKQAMIFCSSLMTWPRNWSRAQQVREARARAWRVVERRLHVARAPVALSEYAIALAYAKLSDY